MCVHPFDSVIYLGCLILLRLRCNESKEWRHRKSVWSEKSPNSEAVTEQTVKTDGGPDTHSHTKEKEMSSFLLLLFPPPGTWLWFTSARCVFFYCSHNNVIRLHHVGHGGDSEHQGQLQALTKGSGNCLGLNSGCKSHRIQWPECFSLIAPGSEVTAGCERRQLPGFTRAAEVGSCLVPAQVSAAASAPWCQLSTAATTVCRSRPNAEQCLRWGSAAAFCHAAKSQPHTSCKTRSRWDRKMM